MAAVGYVAIRRDRQVQGNENRSTSTRQRAQAVADERPLFGVQSHR